MTVIRLARSHSGLRYTGTEGSSGDGLQSQTGMSHELIAANGVNGSYGLHTTICYRS